MSEGPGLDLGRPRTLGELLRDSLHCFFAYPGPLLLVGLAFVAPVQLIIFGVGLGELSAPYEEGTTQAASLISAGVGFFVTAPLVAGAAIHVLAEAAAGNRPRPGTALQAGLDNFLPVFLAVLLSGAGILLGLALLLVPGIYLFVRWYFVPQAAVIEGKQPVEALRHSTEVVHTFWFRVAGIMLLANLLIALVVVVVLLPAEAAAQSADRQVIALVGTIIAESVSVPYIAVLSTLLYYDLRARRARSFVA